MTKIDIFSGFLGAGKTTLIKKLLDEAFKGEKVVLIENEFGEIGIDGGFLKEAGVEITEMNSGCICCSLVGDFGTSLKEVLTKFTPDRILIEPSGVGKLSDVIKAVKDVQEEISSIELNSFTTVADATKCKMYMKNFGEFFNNQIENASTIILSRTQNTTQDKLEAVVKLIKEHNDKATIITTPWEELDGKQILSAMEKKNSLEEELLSENKACGCGHHHEHHHHDGECGCGHHHHEHHHHDGECCGHHHHDEECGCGHHHHHAEDVFTSWGVETPHKYTKEELITALEALSKSEEYGIILRSKGILPSQGEGWYYFDLVPGEYEIREGNPDYTGKICVIGTNLKINDLENLFHLV